MSVLIKGMQKPDKCIDCPFMISRDNDDCILQSDAANELFMNWDDMKLNCPLVELPEHHGRLIDENEVRIVMNWLLTQQQRPTWNDTYHAIQEMNAVVEGE